MTNRPADKGRIAENAVVNYLVDHGFPYAERRRLAGINDKGDIAGSPGLVWEVKYAGKKTSLQLTSWLRETETERRNAHANLGILVVKPPGIGERNSAQFLAVMYVGQFEALMAGAITAGMSGGMVVESHSSARISQLCDRTKALSKQYSHWRVEIPPWGSTDEFMGVVVTTLEQIVTLARWAGYGDPIVLESDSI